MSVTRILPIAALAALVAGCGGTPRLFPSAPATPVPVVDGAAREWRGDLRPVPNEAGLVIGLRNTADALYVAVVARDERQARRIALGGLRFWIDPAGGTDPALGLRFPTPPPPDPADLRSVRGTPHPIRLRDRFSDAVRSVEVRRAGEVLMQTVPVGRIDGLETAAEWGAEDLVVEVRIPLGASSGPLAIPASDVIGLGLEIPDIPGFDPRLGGQRPTPTATPGSRTVDTPMLGSTTRWILVDLADSP